MNWTDVWQFALTATAAVGGLGIIVVGLAIWIRNIITSKITENFKAFHTRELEKLRFKLSAELEKQKAEQQKEIEYWLFRYVISASIPAHFQPIPHESSSYSMGYKHTYPAW